METRNASLFALIAEAAGYAEEVVEERSFSKIINTHNWGKTILQINFTFWWNFVHYCSFHTDSTECDHLTPHSRAPLKVF